MKRLCLLIAIAAVIAAAGCATQGDQNANANAAAAPAPAPAPAPSSSIATASAPAMKNAPSLRSVYYEYDKSDISAEGRKTIEANADYLRSHPGVKVVIQGNADERGSAEYNVALGQRRADGVSKLMGLLGIPGERVETVSFGKEKPKALGHDESAWSQNRRSDIVYR